MKPTYYQINRKKILAKARQNYAEGKANVPSTEDINNRINNSVESFKKLRFTRCKSVAKRRNIEFTITADDIEWNTHCPILGLELLYKISTSKQEKELVVSIDRVDSTKGYVPGNVRTISWQANRIKSNMSKELILSLADYVTTN